MDSEAESVVLNHRNVHKILSTIASIIDTSLLTITPCLLPSFDFFASFYNKDTHSLSILYCIKLYLK